MNETIVDNFHAKSKEETLRVLGVDEKLGLKKEEVARRKERFGANVLPQEKRISRIVLFLRQFKSPLIFILAIAGAVTFIIGEYTDGFVIWAAVLLNTFIGYFQEGKATRALEELRKAVDVKAKVLRNENEIEVSQEELVPGDVIFIRAGDKIPADARIISSWNLRVNEATLTGEWLASNKDTEVLEIKTPLADRENMVYMGTAVEGGEGMAVVVNTGALTEIGKVAVMVRGIEEGETPYQHKLSRFSWLLTSIIGVLTLFIFVDGVITQGNIIQMFTIAVAVAVAAIPEGLPIAMTAILAVGMQRILRQKGLVRKLASVETLGSSSVIATDKTLTLTEGRMEVQEVFTLKQSEKKLALTITSLANDAFVENLNSPFEHWILKGSPTDKALLKASLEAGIFRKDLEKNQELLKRFPFDSLEKYIAVLYKRRGKISAFISGAPEILLDLDKHISTRGRAHFQNKLEEMTGEGLRVVGVGYKDLSEAEYNKAKDPRDVLDNISFIGLIAMKDPIRSGVKEAIQIAKDAGIRTIMVTGDHVRTAMSVARNLGLRTGPSHVIEGKDLNELKDEELDSRLEDISVYARVEPEHKMRIIEAWQRKGEVIAMTGDGINDAPALRKADIGIALGSGTDVAKETSDLILLDDDFSVIPAAIKEGRVIIDNIRKVITYLLASTFSEIILIGVSVVFSLPLPVTATQILWINLIADGFPAVAFTFEKEEKDVMKRKPEKKDAPLLTSQMKNIIFVIGMVSNLMLLSFFLWFLNGSSYSIEYIRTFMFVALGANSMFFVFSLRNFHKNIWQYNPFSNKFLTMTVLIGFLLITAVVYTPFLQEIFHTLPLKMIHWIIIFGFGLFNIALVEINKKYFAAKNVRQNFNGGRRGA